MSLKTNKLRDAICYSLAVGLSALSVSSVAFAQTAPATTQAGQSAKTLDSVVVTGSRIRQVDTETSQPVTFITREDIEKQGFQSVADILQNISATGTPPLSRASPLSAGEAAGGTFISLRNLGATRTLVLLNGRRLGITTSGLADISTIPASAVERIEVLKDGASSIYGSDAIGGVINVITRTNFEGARASAYFGQYSEGDGEIRKADMVLGVSNDRASLTLSGEWREEDGVLATARDFTAFPRGPLHPTDNWTTVGQFGGFVTTATTAVPGLPTGTRVILRPGGNPRVLTDYVRQNTTTGTCAGATTTAGCTPGATADKSNSLEQTDLRTPLKSKSINIDGTFKLTDTINLTGGLLYSNRESDRRVAGYPMQAASFNTPMAATSYFNPTGATISNWWRRTWEVPRDSTSELTTYRFLLAVDGSFEVFKDRPWDWDVSYMHNSNDLLQTTYGNLNLANVRAAVGPSFLNAQGVVQCGTAAAPIAGCVPFNPYLAFGITGQGGLTDNKALRDYLFQEEHATGETTTKLWSANLTGGLFDLPAGEFAFAAGIERRTEAGAFTPDALAVTGGSTNLSSGPTRGSYSVNEFYVELQAPLLRDLPFAKELTVNVASRYSDYDTFGSTTNSKAGFVWKPLQELMVRGTWAEGFRAPTIANLYGGGSQTFSFFTDPCDTLFGSAAQNATTKTNCTNGVGGNGALGALANNYRQRSQTGFAGAPNTQTPVAFTSGSNPTLQPETSRSKTLGVVWSPSFIERLNFALDWWTIRIENTIVADSPSTILDDCYVQGIASRCSAALFTRGADGTPVVSFGDRNAGYREVEGFDFDVSYRWDWASVGQFRIVSNSTYTSKDVLVSTNDPRYPISSVGVTSTFRIRSNANLSWERGIFGASWITRYYSAMAEGCTYFVPGLNEANLECNQVQFAPTGGFIAGTTNPASAIRRRNITGATVFNDVQFRVKTPWDGSFAIGANNVFEKIGPIMYTQPSANVNYYGGFDIGRFVYVKYTHNF
ncbi:MAG: TonB-dependent receptor [Thermomonas sp.]